MAACCSLFILALRCEAQNLVPNPSFEQVDSCPYYPYYYGFQESSKPTYWEKWLNSPDYFNACEGSGDTLPGVPENEFGHQEPFNGSAYIGMWVYGDAGGPYREYVGVQLLEPLKVDSTYNLSFYANAAEGTTLQALYMASNNLGLLFTMHPNIWEDTFGPAFPPRNYASLNSDQVISDTVNWVLVSGTFTADSAYQYLVIGNFFDNVNTDTIHQNAVPSAGAYCYVDAVCVTASTGGCDFGTSIDEGAQSATGRLYPNPAFNTVELSGMGTCNGIWKAWDAVGRFVQEGRMCAGRASIDVSKWDAGNYVISTEGKGRSFVRLIVLH